MNYSPARQKGTCESGGKMGKRDMIPPPREGLPPCVLSVTEFDERGAALSDGRKCGHPGGLYVELYTVRPGLGAATVHPGFEMLGAFLGCLYGHGDADDTDEAAAEAAYARGCEWVRTGVLPPEETPEVGA